MTEKKRLVEKVLDASAWIPIVGVIPAISDLVEKNSVLRDLARKYEYMNYQFTAAIPWILRMSDYFS